MWLPQKNGFIYYYLAVQFYFALVSKIIKKREEIVK